MATSRSKSGEEPEQEAVEPERVVDPPEASAGDAEDDERAPEQKWVRIDQSAMLTLPSGASYSLTAGNTLQLSPEDAAFITDQGYGSEMDSPSEG